MTSSSYLSALFTILVLVLGPLACGSSPEDPEADASLIDAADAGVDAGEPTPLQFPASFEFGDVVVGATQQASLRLYNDGGSAIRVTSIDASEEAFEVLPPTAFELAPGTGVDVVVEFVAALGEQSGTVEVSYEGAEAPLTAALSGTGVEDTGEAELEVTPFVVDFGTVELGDSSVSQLTLFNNGDGLAYVGDVDFESLTGQSMSEFGTRTTGLGALAPGQRVAIDIDWTPQLAGRLQAKLALDIGDETIRYTLKGRAIPAQQPSSLPAPTEVYVAATESTAKNVIRSSNAAAAEVEVSLPDGLVEGYRVVLRMLDGEGAPIRRSVTLGADELRDRLANFVVDTRALSDGPIDLRATIVRGAADRRLKSAPQIGRAAKSTSTSVSLQLDDNWPAYTSSDSVTFTGFVEGADLVTVEGAARSVEESVLPTRTRFEVTVPLRRNQLNTLVVCADAPLERACAPPIEIAHVAPEEFISATSSSRRLSTREVDALVQDGVISLDDPENFHVTEFTICASYDGNPRPVCHTEPVVLPNDGSAGQYGRCTSTRTTNCTSAPMGSLGSLGGSSGGSRSLHVVQPGGNAPAIPVLVVIDGRLKTLKEFFHVSLIIANSSTVYGFESPLVQLLAPSGTTAMRAALGTDANFEVDGPVDQVALPDLAPAPAASEPTSRAAQFLVRGDVAGVYDLGLQFSGYVTGPNLGEPGLFFSGRAAEQIEVAGPPLLDVAIDMPSNAQQDSPFPVTYTVTNVGRVPARYATLDMTVPAELRPAADSGGCGSESSITLDLGHIEPGDSVVRRVDFVACFDGDIAGCNVQADQNLHVSLQTDLQCPAGTNPVDESADAQLGPSVISYSPPAHAQLPLDDVAIEIEFDAPIDGVRTDDLIGGYLYEEGTVYLERVDEYGYTFARVPLITEIEATPSGGSILRLVPVDEDYLTPSPDALQHDARYRVTILGDGVGLFDAVSGAPMQGHFSWTFETTPDAPGLFEVEGFAPSGEGVRTDTVIALRLSNPMDIQASANFESSDFRDLPFTLHRGATIQNSQIVGGTAVNISFSVSVGADYVTLTPSRSLALDETYVIRAGGPLRDIYGNRLAEPFLREFRTTSIRPQGAPSSPYVDPIPRWTTDSTVTVSGRASRGAKVIIEGGARTVSGQARNVLSMFWIDVPLTPGVQHDLKVTVEEGSESSPAVTRDIDGNRLRTAIDDAPPTCTLASPSSGDTVSETILWQFDAFDDNATAEGAKVVYRILDREGESAVDTTNEATTPLSGLPDGTYTVDFACRDAAGNTGPWRSIDLVVDNPDVPIIESIAPQYAVIGQTTTVTLQGHNLDALINASLDSHGARVDIIGPNQLEITVPEDASDGLRTLTLDNAIGSASTPIEIAPPRPTLLSVSPDKFLADVGPYTISLEAEGLRPSALIKVTLPDGTSGFVQPDMRNRTSLVRQFPMLPQGSVRFAVANPRLQGYVTSASRTVEVVEPTLSVVGGDAEVFAGQTKTLEIELPAPAPSNGALIEFSAPVPTNSLQFTPQAMIPRGETRAQFQIRGVQAGDPVVLMASVGNEISTQFTVTVREAPIPGVASGSVVAQPMVPSVASIGIDQAAPTPVTVDLTSGGAAVALSPTQVDIPAGASSADFEVLTDRLGDFSFEATTPFGTSSGAIPIESRQAVAETVPEVLRASTLDNEVTIRVSTDGANNLLAARVEVPDTWSTPSQADVTATLGDGTDIGANLSRGGINQAPNGGTYLTLTGLDVAPTDSQPYAQITIGGMTPIALGDTTWRVDVDNGQGFSPVAHHPVLTVSGTAGDGAGQATIQPDPLSAGSRQDVDLELVNDVAQRTDPTTIFRDWTAYGEPRHDWAVRNLKTDYGASYPDISVLRTTQNTAPGYFISVDSLGLGRLEAQLGAFTASDDDYIGTIVRWQDECNFYLVDWKQSEQQFFINGANRMALRGLALRKVVDCDFDGDGVRDRGGTAGIQSLWGNDPSGSVTNLAINSWSGYADNTLHTLEIDMLDAGAGAVEFVISVDGIERLRYTDTTPLPAGRYGPYSFSQSHTVFGEVKVVRPEATIEAVEVELPAGWPLLAAGDYEVLVDSVDVTSSVSLSLSPAAQSGPATIRISGLDLAPGQFLVLRSLDLLVPTAGTYEFVVRTSGPGGTLEPIAAWPTVTVN